MMINPYYGIWKDRYAERVSLWEDIMKSTLEFFDKMKQLGYEDREGQQSMCCDIIECIRDNQDIIVEASVGIGKSYAYLIPLMYYHKITKRTFIISTSTITLQEQIEKDILELSKKLNIPIIVTIAKGKNNYLCQERLFHSKDKHIKNKFKNLNEKFFLNDRAQVQDINDYIWNKINVEDCKFNKCSYFWDCYFISKRDKMKETKGAVICNHDLLLANQRRKMNELNLLLSASEVIVLDEAHNLEDKARNSYKKSFSQLFLKNIVERAYKLISKRAYNIDYSEYENMESGIVKLFKEIERQAKVESNKLIQNNVIISISDMGDCNIIYTKNLISISKILYKCLKGISASVQLYDKDKNEDSIADNFLEVINFFKELARGKESLDLFWIERNKMTYSIASCPKNIGKKIKEILFNDKDTVKVLTSATLGTMINKGDYYKYFMKSVGLIENDKLFLSDPKESHFDIENNTLLYYSNDITHYKTDYKKYIEDITNRIVDLISITQGKCLILFTAKSDMKRVYNNLITRNLPYKIIVQKDGSSQIKIKEEFSEDINSVLLSTGTFWEGIDIKGEALSMVIIVRLPFPIGDPVVEYKKSLVKDPMDIYLPEMIIRLKQGVGRLIRCDTDKGVIALLDSRVGDLSRARYKQQVFDSIKTVNRTNNLEDVKTFVIDKGIVAPKKVNCIL